jgi:hypothetical protein
MINLSTMWAPIDKLGMLSEEMGRYEGTGTVTGAERSGEAARRNDMAYLWHLPSDGSCLNVISG